MTDFLQLLLSGVARGPSTRWLLWASRCCGKAAGTINFAQGEFVMLPASPC